MKTPAFTPAQRLRVILLSAVVPIVIAATGIIVMLTWRDLPDPIAVHWNSGGEADGFGTVGLMAGIVAIVIVSFAVLSTLAVIHLRATAQGHAQPRFLVGTSVWFSVFLTVGIVGSVAIQRGLADAAAAPTVTPMLGVALAIATVLGVVAGVLTPRPRVAEREESSEPPRLDLAPEERAVFSRTIPPTPAALVFFAVGALLVIAAGVLVAVAAEPVLFIAVAIPALVLVLAFGSLNWRLRITGRGVDVRGLAGLPRFIVPLEEIAAASVVDVQPMGEFGGWGIRFGAGGRTGIILRSGEALEVTRHTGRSLVITVDDAVTAAGLINGLVQRSGSDTR